MSVIAVFQILVVLTLLFFSLFVFPLCFTSSSDLSPFLYNFVFSFSFLLLVVYSFLFLSLHRSVRTLSRWILVHSMPLVFVHVFVFKTNRRSYFHCRKKTRCIINKHKDKNKQIQRRQPIFQHYKQWILYKNIPQSNGYLQTKAMRQSSWIPTARKQKWLNITSNHRNIHKTTETFHFYCKKNTQKTFIWETFQLYQ